MGKPLPRLHDLSPADVQQVIEDLELELIGAKIFYAIEPSELFDYCFPINPRNSVCDIDSVADDQAALYEIFYVRKDKPILLPEYVQELQGIISYAERELRRVYKKAEMIETLIRGAGLGDIANRGEDELQDIILNHFNVILAVAMGIYKFGTGRFTDIFSNHLLKSRMETGISEDNKVLERIFKGYSQTDLVTRLTDRWKSTKKITDPADKERFQRNLKIDARAVDRIIYLNLALEKAYENHDLNRRHIILYLSNWKRGFLNMPAVRNALKISGQKFRFWRTRNQIFAYVVHKSKNKDRTENIRESIENLKKVKQILEEVHKLGRDFPTLQCERCLLFEHTPSDCGLEGFCSNVLDLQHKIEEGRQQIENLGLVNTINDYKRIMDMPTQESTNEKYQQYLDLFIKAYNSGMKDIAMDGMRTRQQLILIKSEASNLFKTAYLRTNAGEDRYAFRRKEDRVTGIDQILPTKPKLKSQRYSDILDSILDYYRDPTHVELLEAAHKGFLELDLGTIKPEPEQELVRCYLYLAFARGRDELKAFRYAKDLLENEALIAEDPDIEQEYRYVLCWAARRVGEFNEADRCAREGITSSGDARFYHGASLNIYSWLTAGKESKARSKCPYAISQAIDYAQRAIELYQEKEYENKDVIAANYNNLAFYYAWEVTENRHSLEEGQEILHKARAALTTLKEVTKKEDGTWNPNHPEFYHTEAYLEYQEYLIDFAAGRSNEYLIDKLQNAKREIDIAVDLYKEGPLYRELKETIEKSLDQITAGRLTS